MLHWLLSLFSMGYGLPLNPPHEISINRQRRSGAALIKREAAKRRNRRG